jgi:hypothetical protein
MGSAIRSASETPPNPRVNHGGHMNESFYAYASITSRTPT